MKLNYCVACAEDDPTKLEHHHLVPRSAGGSDHETNLITLCHVCHGKAHGFERRNIRALSAAGIAKAKANGKKIGNPGMKARDPEAIRKIAEARDANYLKQIKPTADAWLPIVHRMRPAHGWDEVISAIKTETGQEWSVGKLTRALKRLALEGLVDPSLLPQKKPPSVPFVSQVDPVATVIDVLRHQPGITIEELADLLQQMGVQSPDGSGRKWEADPTLKVLEQARSRMSKQLDLARQIMAPDPEAVTGAP